MTRCPIPPAERPRLRSGCLTGLGFLALVAFFAFIVVPGLRMRTWADPGAPQVEAVHGEDGWLDPTDYPPARRKDIPPIDPRTVMTPTPLLLARGETLYTQSCASCHGPRGAGDGPGARGLSPAVRNFTVGTGWTYGPRIEDLYRTLEEGIQGSSMASYSYLSKEDRMALIHYVRSLGAFDHGRSDPKALEALARRLASEGETLPNRIPVRMALEHLEREDRPVPPLKGFPADPILRQAIQDPQKAARTLAGVKGWQKEDATLARAVSQGLPGNGFATQVLTWPPARWRELRSALSRP